jgi:hypothetical protein
MKVVAETTSGIWRADNYEIGDRCDRGFPGGMLDRASAESRGSRTGAGEE